jgi:hypothetical protein
MHDSTLIFIAGLHRSGTSLLHEILREHQDISGFSNTHAPKDEGQHLQSVYKPARLFGGPGQFAFNADCFMDEYHSLVSTANAEELFMQWSAYWTMPSKYLIEKSPPNIIRTRFLQALFPKARFIIIMRHPVAVAYATQKWSKTSIEALIEHSLIAYERLLIDRAFLQHSFLIRYEDFVLNPQQTLNTIYDFLGLQPQLLKQAVSSDINEKYFAMWKQNDSDYINAISAVFEQRMNAIGYSFNDI